MPALSIRFGGDFRIGVAPGFLFSTGRLTFAEDTTPMASERCGGTHCGARTRSRRPLRRRLGPVDRRREFSVTLGGGIYWRRKNVEFGLAY